MPRLVVRCGGEGRHRIATEGNDIDVVKTAHAAASILRVTTKAWLEGDPLDLQYLARLLPVGDVRVRQDGDRFYLAGAL